MQWYRLIFSGIFCAITGFLLAQSCCSGGVPVANNLGLTPQETGSWQVNISYDLNTLHTLKSGGEVLNDDARQRQTHAALVQLGYSFHPRWSIEGFVSYVRQERLIRQFGRRDETATAGIGDAVALIKYQLYSGTKGSSWWLGLGAKAPTGTATETDARGITLNADLQPGSGAWDAILWSQWSNTLAIRPSMTAALSTIYSYKGQNDSYLGNQVYQFGVEWQLIAQLSDQWLIGKQLWTPSLALRWRQVANDLQNDEDVPGTGGHWLFIRPSVGWPISEQLGASISLELPLYAYVRDTQVTPTYRLTVQLSMVF